MAKNKTATTTQTSTATVTGEATVLNVELNARANELVAAVQKRFDAGEFAGQKPRAYADALAAALLTPIGEGNVSAWEHYGPYINRCPRYAAAGATTLKNRVGESQGTPGSAYAIRSLFTNEISLHQAKVMAIFGKEPVQYNPGAVGVYHAVMQKCKSSDDARVKAFGNLSRTGDQKALRAGAQEQKAETKSETEVAAE